MNLLGETHNSNFSKTLDTSYRKMGTPISYTKACVMSKTYLGQSKISVVKVLFPYSKQKKFSLFYE